MKKTYRYSLIGKLYGIFKDLHAVAKEEDDPFE